ncbi:hypothetical protein M5D96_002442 [Drosophila gunungcola]|uniref:Uncharacterized protein n=1 Tax=Drosophila gunungcola TaxID=103775 RepID=A0A9P9YZY5_9MUSC|nr:hypothetical protein M5D96_002442 [Drosophila gunungcola]
MKVKVERTTKKPAITRANDHPPEKDDEVMDQEGEEDQVGEEDEELDFLPADLTAAISTPKIATTAATPTTAMVRNLIVSEIHYLYTLETGTAFLSVVRELKKLKIIMADDSTSGMDHIAITYWIFFCIK